MEDEEGQELILKVPQEIYSDCGVVLQVIQGKSSRKRKAPNNPPAAELPLCNFEVKGPTLDLTGIAAAKEVHEKIAKLRGARSEGVERIGMDTLVEGDTHTPEDQDNSPDSNSVSPDSVDSHYGHEQNEHSADNSGRAYTAAEVADNFNFLFSSPVFLNVGKSLGGPIRDSIYRISQAVTNAVLSLGGCAVLYNVGTAIAFKVKGTVNRKLVIRVTGVMQSDSSPNGVAAMYAVGKYCMDEYFKNGPRNLMKRVRELSESISHSAGTREEEDSLSSHQEYLPETESDESEATSGEAVGANAMLLIQMELGLDLSSLLGQISHGGEQRCHGVHSPTTVVANDRKLTGKQIGKSIDEAIMSMFMKRKGVVGSGSSGIVVRSCFIGRDAAVKVAFNNCESGTAALRREITTYLELHRKSSPLLGSVLPNLLLAWNSPSLKSLYAHMVFLVTEFVGRRLVRDDKGVLWIGDSGSDYELVDKKEEHMVCTSALNGLRLMRDHGMLHGDIALRNIRAERIESTSGVLWRTWWVDLGLSSTIKSRWDARLFAIDCMDTRSLFNI